MKFEYRPISGVGVGLRPSHYHQILTTKPKINWFEAISENYFGQRLLPLYHLTQIRDHYPIVLHGVSLSIGSSDPLNFEYLKGLRDLIAAIEPNYISDHLSWSSFDGRYCPDLLPLPFNQESLNHVVDRIHQVQEFLKCQITLENISRYVDFNFSDMTEAAFHKEVALKGDCYLLIDINNIYVNSCHHGFNAREYFHELPGERVRQYHLGGFTMEQGVMIDTHGASVSEPVWGLYQYSLKVIGERPTLIEWDNHIPDLEVLMQQAALAENYIKASREA